MESPSSILDCPAFSQHYRHYRQDFKSCQRTENGFDQELKTKNANSSVCWIDVATNGFSNVKQNRFHFPAMLAV